MKESFERNQTNSKKAVDKKLAKLFGKFDQKGTSYQLTELNEMEFNLKNLLLAVKSDLKEDDHGSERCAMFIEYITERVPGMYQKMIKEHRHEER